MRPRSDYTEITVMAGPRRGEGPDLPTPPEPGVGGGNVEVTVVAGPDFLPTRVVPADQGTVRAETTEPQDSGEPPCPPDLDLLGMIGEGAMGQVLLARDRALRRRVAYKRLRAELTQQREIAHRLLAEAQITAQLDHPNVVPLYFLEQGQGQTLGYVMKLVEGETLAALIEQARRAVGSGRPLAPALRRESLLEHFLKVCDAVAFAHAKGVIHRDLKPANIMVGRFNEVYVMDWGIARVLNLPDVLPGDAEKPVQDALDTSEEGRGATVYGSLIGTPKYMSPEQARGEIDRLDPRSDLYSLGLILYELVCLRPAFGGFGSDSVMERVRRGERAPVVAPSRRLAVPPELQAIIDKATRAKPEDRYPHVAAMARDLRGFLRGEPVSVLPDTPLRRTLRWIGQHRQVVLNLFLATLLLGSLATGALWYRHMAAMEEVRDRRELTMRYLSLASARAQGVVQHFTRILGHLEGLSVAAELALEFGEATDARTYTGDDFDSPSTRPGDLAGSHHYPGRPISTEHPVAFFPPDDADPTTEQKVRRLVALKPLLQRIFLEANGERDVHLSGPRVREMLDQGAIDVRWLGIALREGALVGYPGLGGFRAGYDPTQRPWYRQALPERGSMVCGEPFLDAQSPILDLACSVALYSSAGEFLGVAYVELPLAAGVAKLLDAPDLPQTRALLLDDRGQVLVEVGDDGAEPGGWEPLHLYRDEAIVEAARVGRSGLQERVDGERSLWVIHVYLPELKWTYVTELYAWGVKDPHADGKGTRPRRPSPPSSNEVTPREHPN